MDTFVSKTGDKSSKKERETFREKETKSSRKERETPRQKEAKNPSQAPILNNQKQDKKKDINIIGELDELTRSDLTALINDPTYDFLFKDLKFVNSLHREEQ